MTGCVLERFGTSEQKEAHEGGDKHGKGANHPPVRAYTSHDFVNTPVPSGESPLPTVPWPHAEESRRGLEVRRTGESKAQPGRSSDRLPPSNLRACRRALSIVKCCKRTEFLTTQ